MFVSLDSGTRQVYLFTFFELEEIDYDFCTVQTGDGQKFASKCIEKKRLMYTHFAEELERHGVARYC